MGKDMPNAVAPRILVVDDYPANRMAVELVLEPDYQVVLADSGRKALELASKEEFAVILLDVRMPDMDGLETATRLRRMETARTVPIVFTSAVDQSLGHVNQGFQAGATDYLFSPVDPAFLKFKVDTYAQIQLRNGALREQIQQLTEALRALRAELERNAPVEGALRTKIRRLEALNDDLRRQLTPVASGIY